MFFKVTKWKNIFKNEENILQLHINLWVENWILLLISENIYALFLLYYGKKFLFLFTFFLICHIWLTNENSLRGYPSKNHCGLRVFLSSCIRENDVDSYTLNKSKINKHVQVMKMPHSK
jgi:hypothetical protein